MGLVHGHLWLVCVTFDISLIFTHVLPLFFMSLSISILVPNISLVLRVLASTQANMNPSLIHFLHIVAQSAHKQAHSSNLCCILRIMKHKFCINTLHPPFSSQSIMITVSVFCSSFLIVLPWLFIEGSDYSAGRCLCESSVLLMSSSWYAEGVSVLFLSGHMLFVIPQNWA